VKNFLRTTAAVLSLCLFAVSCDFDCFDKSMWDGKYDNVFIYWGGGINNLYTYLTEDINDICAGELPLESEHKAVLVLSHLANNYQYNPAPTYMIRLYKKNGKTVRDTLRTYGQEFSETDPAFFSSVLSDIRKDFPSEHYGILFSSHGTSYLPEGYYEKYPGAGKSGETGRNSLGCTVINDNWIQELDIKDFANAFPMHMDYILLDACLMGGVEVAYQLRNTCKYLVASPTEILTEGFCYSTLVQRLFRENCNLEMVCKDYMDQNNHTNATISLIDCSAMDNLAIQVGILARKYSSQFDKMSRDKNSIQRFYRYDSHWFYDLCDIFRAAGASRKELEILSAAIMECVLYKDFSDSFLSSFEIRTCCGLSMYLPDSSFIQLNNYYKSLDWNKACGLVQ